jgi:sulfate adenylyltransferase
VSLVPVHGGLDALVNRQISLSRRKALVAEAPGMAKVCVADSDLATVYRIADGTLSPLIGFMNQDVYDLVLSDRVIESKGARYAWTIPLSLPVTDEEAAALTVGTPAVLVDGNGTVVGLIEVESIFDWDKTAYVKSVYGTDRMDHPGGDIVSKDPRTKLIGGAIQALPATKAAGYGHLVLSPAMTRTMIADRGWEKALAFQTRNPLHRAHEYALVYGLEQLTRAGHFAGAVLNPLVGQLKGDDVNAATRMLTYQALRDNRGLGEGDSDAQLWADVGYDLNDVFELAGLDIKMFYGGPAEAVMHGIYRQNHGFTNIVIGRKHADAPFFDKTAIWGDFDAQAIFDDLPGALAIEPVKVGFAAYYDSLGRVDLMSNHKGEKAMFISGSKVRSMLIEGSRPPSQIMRPATADILIEAYAANDAN